ncbi:choline dehydrogenase [Fusarium beomiforme]|uniref:Choline dehydrogenase n=1 Tax=Fusarium beomiforme TaxID=44412 RepID=A0A9P5AQE7_9HYPO|nr:choline dehydrogenase [Fusarium beomiforme]
MRCNTVLSPSLLALSLSTCVTAQGPFISTLLDPLQHIIKSAYAGDGLKVGHLGDLGGIPGADAEYDYVVVGGGTAGNTIGYRLAKAGYSVAIVEAGPFLEISKPILATAPGGVTAGSGSSLLDSNPLRDWKFTTTPQTGINDREIHYARGKVLGGSSQLNFLVYHRPTNGTMAKWAEDVGDDSYTWEQMLPHFQKSPSFTPPDNEKRGPNVTTDYDPSAFSKEKGPLQISYANYVPSWAVLVGKGLKSLGLKSIDGFSSGSLLGYSYTTTTVQPKTATRSASDDFVKTARSEKLKTLKVYTESLAKKVTFDDDKKATGVEVTSVGIDYTLKARKEVIVSGGTFQSPQVLMVSGVGPKKHLEELDIPVVADLPGVGQNLWDHVLFGPSFEVQGLDDTLSVAINNDTVFQGALQAYAEQQAGPLTSNQVELLGWEKTPEKYRSKFSAETLKDLETFPDDWPEMEIIPINVYSEDWQFPILQQPTDGKKYTTINGALVAPLSRGNITLRTNSTSDAPLINPNFLTSKTDQEVAVALFRRIREIAKSPPMKDTVLKEVYPGEKHETDEQILAVLRDTAMTVWHAACTCKMGKKDDKMAVLDSKARVYGVKGLRVVDASAFPVLIPGHPVGTVYALAEKIAHDIITEQESDGSAYKVDIDVDVEVS